MLRTDLHLDDLNVGDRFEGVAYTVTEADIIEFARKYDPQPFHLAPEAAKQTLHGGLIASGFHTLAAGFRSLHATGWMTTANLGGLGIDDLRFLKPVRPGDTLRTTAIVTEIIPSKSKPDRGVVKHGVVVRNQAGEDVLTANFAIMVRRCRPSHPGELMDGGPAKTAHDATEQ